MTPTMSRRASGLVTIAVTSGKGGVGKTSVAVNLAVSLARLRHRVAILDADFALGNVDVLLGLAPTVHLGHVLAGEKSIDDILVPGPDGVYVIPASSGLQQLTALAPVQWARLAAALDRLAHDFDYLVIDTAAGISDNVIDTLKLADRVLVVTSLEPGAVVDSYALIKLLSAAKLPERIGIIVNQAQDLHEAQVVFRQLDIAAARFLGLRLTYCGFVAFDAALKSAVLAQRPVVDHRPQSSASRCFRILASRLAGMDPHRGHGLRLVTPPLQSADRFPEAAQWA